MLISSAGEGVRTERVYSIKAHHLLIYHPIPIGPLVVVPSPAIGLSAALRPPLRARVCLFCRTGPGHVRARRSRLLALPSFQQVSGSSFSRPIDFPHRMGPPAAVQLLVRGQFCVVFLLFCVSIALP